MKEMFIENNGKLSYTRVMGFLACIISFIGIICGIIMMFMFVPDAIVLISLGFGIIPFIFGAKTLQKKFEEENKVINTKESQWDGK